MRGVMLRERSLIMGCLRIRQKVGAELLFWALNAERFHPGGKS